MSFKLVEIASPQRTFLLTPRGLTVGRDPRNDVVLTDASVSRQHAKLVLDPQGVRLHDLSSANGTFVNGRRVASEQLWPGDTVRFGSVDCRLVGAAAEAAAPPPIRQRPAGPMPPPPPPRASGPPPAPYGALPYSPPAPAAPAAPRRSGAGTAILVSVLVVAVLGATGAVFLPLYSAETGTIATCKQCNKQIENSAHTIKTNLLERSKYSVVTRQDYCPQCGGETVSYMVRVHCSRCGRKYREEQRQAPRREERKDESPTEGYCSGGCQMAAEVGEIGNGVGNLIKGLINP